MSSINDMTNETLNRLGEQFSSEDCLTYIKSIQDKGSELVLSKVEKVILDLIPFLKWKKLDDLSDLVYQVESNIFERKRMLNREKWKTNSTKSPLNTAVAEEGVALIESCEPDTAITFNFNRNILRIQIKPIVEDFLSKYCASAQIRLNGYYVVEGQGGNIHCHFAVRHTAASTFEVFKTLSMLWSCTLPGGNVWVDEINDLNGWAHYMCKAIKSVDDVLPITVP